MQRRNFFPPSSLTEIKSELGKTDRYDVVRGLLHGILGYFFNLCNTNAGGMEQKESQMLATKISNELAQAYMLLMVWADRSAGKIWGTSNSERSLNTEVAKKALCVLCELLREYYVWYSESGHDQVGNLTLQLVRFFSTKENLPFDNDRARRDLNSFLREVQVRIRSNQSCQPGHAYFWLCGSPEAPEILREGIIPFVLIGAYEDDKFMHQPDVVERLFEYISREYQKSTNKPLKNLEDVLANPGIAAKDLIFALMLSRAKMKRDSMR